MAFELERMMRRKIRNLWNQVAADLATSSATNATDTVQDAIIAMSVMATSADTAGEHRYPTRSNVLLQGQYPMRRLTIMLL